MPGRRSTDDFTVEILDSSDTKYTSLYHRRFKKTYIVAKAGEEYQVRVTVKPPAWDLHDHPWFFAKLMVDDRYVRGRFLKKPESYYDGGEPHEDISWTFNTMNGGWAFKFNHRSEGGASQLTERDWQVGQIQVSFMAACKREYRDRPSFRRRRDDFYEEPQSFDGNLVNQNQKDKISLMRTIKGRRLHRPMGGGGGGAGGCPPATIVSDFVYATVTVHYDSADHLRYRGILRPQSIKEHRQWFPEEDFRRDRRQQVRATLPEKRCVLDLTGNDLIVRREHTKKRKAEERSRRVHEHRERERQREVNIGLPYDEEDSSTYADGDFTSSSLPERSWKRRKRNKSHKESDDEKDWEPVYDDGI